MTHSEIVDVLGDDTGGMLSNVLDELEQLGLGGDDENAQLRQYV